MTTDLRGFRKSVNGCTILLVGLAYKRNSRDTRQSPAVAVAKKLADLGADLRGIDPLISADEIPGYLRMVPCEPGQIVDADLVIVLADHDAIDWEIFELHGDRILDTPNRLRSPSVVRL